MQDIKSIAINRIQSEIDSNANGSGDSNNNNGALASIDQHWTNPLEFDQLDKMQSRTNTIVHVCWQRACSISYYDYRYALTVSFNSLVLDYFIYHFNIFRFRSVVIYCESLRIAVDGKSYGSSLLIFVYSSTKHLM